MNARRMKDVRGVFLAALFLLLAAGVQAQYSNSASATVVPSADLVQPAQLNQELQAHPKQALILQVGSRVLYQESHIPGSEYAGPGASPTGLQMLRARVASLPRSREIVIYCGCCPWDRCPNIGPAWNLLKSMGFTHVRALYLANNFGADWVGKGYRAEPSH